jgi:hypothetical protein
MSETYSAGACTGVRTRLRRFGAANINAFLDTVIRRYAAPASIGLALLAAPASPKADPLGESPREGAMLITKLSEHASAFTYWVKRGDGIHVVTTVDTALGDRGDDEGHSVVRFAALLQPDQSVEVSVPLALGARPQVLRMHRIADRIEAELVPA